jgi:hypothetical protein
VFCVISVYFNIRNTLPKSGTFLLGYPVYALIVPLVSVSWPEGGQEWPKHVAT